MLPHPEIKTSWVTSAFDPSNLVLHSNPTVEVNDVNTDIHHLVLAAIIEGVEGREDIRRMLLQSGIHIKSYQVGFVLRELRDAGYLVRSNVDLRRLTIPERAKPPRFTQEDIAFIQSTPVANLTNFTARYGCSVYTLKNIKYGRPAHIELSK